MTATARFRHWRATPGAARPAGIARLLAFAPILLALAPAPAAAQVAATVGAESAYRYRGHSLSAGKPVATIDLSYDDKSGIYLSGFGAFTVTGSDPGLLTAQADLGFAKRVTPRLALDAGVTHTEYTHRRGNAGSIGYTEFYAGVSRGKFSSRLYYSPDYLAAGVGTLYGEAELALEPHAHWGINLHAGKLVYVANRPRYANPNGQYDWSVGVSRQLGAVDLHATVSGGGPGRDYYVAEYHSRTAVTAGISYTF